MDSSLITKKKLEDLYLTKQYSTVDIGKMYDLPHWKINKMLKLHKIPVRSREERQKTAHAIEKTKNTNLKKYGEEYGLKNKEIISKRVDTVKKRYGVGNVFQSEVFQEKARKTTMDKYGVENAMLSEEVKSKLKNSVKEKYGVENTFQNEEIKKKSKNTKMKKYGDENYVNPIKNKETCYKKYGETSYSKLEECKDKVKNTNFERFNNKFYSQTDECKSKSKNTLIARYGSDYKNVLAQKRRASYKNKTGYDHPFQNPECLHKMFVKWLKKKEYKFPSGRVEMVQGYEPFILNQLLSEGFKEDDIVIGIKNVPIIRYVDDFGKNRSHFPDIYIKSKNLLIEVKNEYCVSIKRDFLLYRKNKAINLGYQYKILVYSKKTKEIYEIN